MDGAIIDIASGSKNINHELLLCSRIMDIRSIILISDDKPIISQYETFCSNLGFSKYVPINEKNSEYKQHVKVREELEDAIKYRIENRENLPRPYRNDFLY